MTDQLKTAMSEYPDELRVVMERAGYKRFRLGWRRWTDASGAYGFATDNDAIVACLEWLMDEALNHLDMTDVAHYRKHYSLLIALLIVVRDAMA